MNATTHITIIAAVCRNGAIGRRGQLLYHISDDLRRFKALTMGHPIIMGRKTFESFPKGPLPGRRNIVITRSADYAPAAVEVVHSPQEALQAVEGVDNAYVIGGAEIYRAMLPVADELELTEIDAAPTDADAFFPAPGPDFELHAASPAQGDSPRYRFATYRRK